MIKSNTKWMINGNEQQDNVENTQPQLTEYKEPGVVETVNNRIYFYSPIDTDKMLFLTKTIKEKEDEMLVRKKTWKLNEVPAIHLHIQSYGGFAHAGISGFDLINSLEVPLYTYVDGVAASAATLLSVAGKRRFISKNSFMLIHQASFTYWGSYTHENLKDEMKNAESLMKVIKRIYLEKTSIPEKKLNELLKRDLYFDAEECLKYNMVDEII